MMYSVRVMDDSFNLKCEIDDYTSLIITNDFYTGGTLEMVISEAKGNTEHLVEGNIIFPAAESDMPYIIRYVKRVTSARNAGSTELSVSAISLVRTFKQRMTYGNGTDYERYTSQKAEYIIKEWIDSNIVSASDADRNVSFYQIAADQSRGSTITEQTKYKSLFDEVVRLGRRHELGLYFTLNFSTSKAIFDVREGTDRTYENGVNAEALFALNFGNIKKQSYTVSYLNHADVAYVAGQGVGTDRTVAEIGAATTGLDRYETFIDARDLSVEAELQERGQEKLAAFPDSVNFEVEILDTSTLVYGTDWDVGDKVTIIDEATGTQYDRQVISITETREGLNSLRLSAKFGIPERNVAVVLREIETRIPIEETEDENKLDKDLTGLDVKGTPVNADILVINDSAASWAEKKATLGSLPYPSPTLTIPMVLATQTDTLTGADSGYLTLTSVIAHSDFTVGSNYIDCEFDGKIALLITVNLEIENVDWSHDMTLDIHNTTVSDKIFTYNYNNDETDHHADQIITMVWGMSVSTDDRIQFEATVDDYANLKNTGTAFMILRVE